MRDETTSAQKIDGSTRRVVVCLWLRLMSTSNFRRGDLATGLAGYISREGVKVSARDRTIETIIASVTVDMSPVCPHRIPASSLVSGRARNLLDPGRRRYHAPSVSAPSYTLQHSGGSKVLLPVSELCSSLKMISSPSAISDIFRILAHQQYFQSVHMTIPL